MNTVVLWILLFGPAGNRSATVVEKFSTEAQCRAAVAQITKLEGIAWNEGGIPKASYPVCIRVEAAR